MSSGKHIGFIESLRAIAACSVMGFHFICFYNGIGQIYWNETVKNIATFGAQGVEMFYIISGFVITYALTRSKYDIGSYCKYVMKRVIRIIPVYFMLIVAIYAFEYILSTYVWGYEMSLNYRNIIANLTFTVDLWEGATWINPIFLTLSVEFQFYLLIGILLPLMNYRLWFKYVALAGMIIIGLYTSDYQSVFCNAPYFALGILLNDIYSKKLLTISYISIAVILLVLLKFYMVEDFVVAIITAALFLAQKPSFKVSNEIGKISYSLYLTHGLFGGWLLFFLSRDDYINWSPYIIVPLAVVFSLLGAKLFYVLFEKPSMRLAKKVKYDNQLKAEYSRCDVCGTDKSGVSTK